MIQLNSQKSVKIIAVLSTIMLLYAAYFDIFDLHIPLTTGYVLQKTFFALICPFIVFFFKKIHIDKKVFIMSFIFSTYIGSQVYFYSINYMIGSIQIVIMFTSVLFLEKKQFIIFFTFLTSITLLAMIYTPAKYGFSKFGPEIRDLYINDYISLQFTAGLIYVLITYGRLKKLKEDMKFSNFGKASSFILHEMQKPMNRLNMNEHNNDDLNSLRKTLEIAKKLQQGSITDAKIESISLELIAEEVLSKYKDFLDFYEIKVSLDLLHSKYKTDRELIILILDNLIRNAIEANKENAIDNRWLKITSTPQGFNVFNPFTSMIAASDLFTPLKSSKIGNMGTGLHFCKTISEGLGHTIKVKCKQNVFEAQLEF